MIRYALLAAALTFMTATSAAATWVSRDLNLRTGPGTHYHVRTVLPRCANVHVHRRHHNWYQVTWRGHRGWVAGQHLSRHQPRHCHRHYHHRPPHGYRPHRPHRY